MKRLLYILVFFAAVACAPAQKVARYSLKVEQEYPHDTLSYTQGLFFDGDLLYESAGQYGESRLMIVDLESGQAVRQTPLDKKYFAEGSCAIDSDVYMLTWLEGVCLKFDKETLEPNGQFVNKRQGWGLTTDGSILIMSDGSAQLYFVSPKTFTVVRSVTVRLGGKSVNYLNELEWIDGKIWANVYTKDDIMIIDPATGVVEGVIDCRGLLPKDLRSERTDVLNGIACHPDSGDIFLTGKYWPRMYKVSLVEKK